MALETVGVIHVLLAFLAATAVMMVVVVMLTTI